MWHPCRTVKMGKPEEAGTCVDVNFKVCGLERLRVVDMSVAPLLPRYVPDIKFCGDVRTDCSCVVRILNRWPIL